MIKREQCLQAKGAGLPVKSRQGHSDRYSLSGKGEGRTEKAGFLPIKSDGKEVKGTAKRV